MGQLACFVALGVMNVDAVSTCAGFFSGSFANDKG
jgi:hypothetical protein